MAQEQQSPEEQDSPGFFSSLGTSLLKSIENIVNSAAKIAETTVPVVVAERAGMTPRQIRQKFPKKASAMGLDVSTSQPSTWTWAAIGAAVAVGAYFLLRRR